MKGGAIHTQVVDCFIAGITRGTVLELARRRGIGVIERRIIPAELSWFEECFICGTAAEITPVSEIGPHTFAPGAITNRMIDDYAAAVTLQALAAYQVKKPHRTGRKTARHACPSCFRAHCSGTPYSLQISTHFASTSLAKRSGGIRMAAWVEPPDVTTSTKRFN